MTNDLQSGDTAPGQQAGRATSRRTLLAGLAGFLAAAAIAVVLVATGVVGAKSDDPHKPTTSGQRIALPERVGGFTRYADVPLNKQGIARRNVQLQTQSTDATAHDLSVAYRGAPAAVETYADDRLLTVFTVWAVRAYTPAPVVFHALPALTGLAQQQDEVRAFGEVYCELHPIRQTPAGQTPPPDNQFVSLCQRSDEHLTVAVHGGGSTQPFNDPVQIAALVNQVWNQLD
jgi:hypothetical protein